MEKVYSFYKDLPFNFADDPEFFVENIKQKNQIHEYKDLHELLSKKSFFKNKVNKVIEFGCGTGWLTNSIAYYYGKKVKAVDFTKKAVDLAKKVSNNLKREVLFEVSDIFDYQDNNKYDLVISLGVLHHTKDCKAAFRKISKFVAKGGTLYVGLYHLYGRRPMLTFLQGYERWYGEEAAFKLFSKMNPSMQNEIFCKSWFRDQVLHPHETQHTVLELLDWIDEIGFKLKSSSINSYKNLKKFSKKDIAKLELEKEISSYDKNINKLIFDPGYFTICAERIH